MSGSYDQGFMSGGFCSMSLRSGADIKALTTGVYVWGFSSRGLCPGGFCLRELWSGGGLMSGSFGSIFIFFSYACH